MYRVFYSGRKAKNHRALEVSIMPKVCPKAALFIRPVMVCRPAVASAGSSHTHTCST